MFDNIGGKIKGLAKFIGCVGVLGALICMIAVWFTPRFPSPGGFVIFLMGVGACLAGLIGAWVCAMLTYGFGQLIEDTGLIRSSLSMAGQEGDEETIVDDQSEQP